MPATLVKPQFLAPVLLALGLTACVVHDTQPVNPGYGYGVATQPHASIVNPTGRTVAGDQVATFYVESMPPEPLYEQMSDSPGDGTVWIDGYWHWNGYEWLWVSGRWEREQAGYVYVEPSYSYDDAQTLYVYTPGYWAQPDRVPHGWAMRDHGDGRPARVSPPVSPAGHRPPVAGYPPPHRGGGGGDDGGSWHHHPGMPTTPTNGDPGGGTAYYPPPRSPSGPAPSPAPMPQPGGGAITTSAPSPQPQPQPAGGYTTVPYRPGRAPTRSPSGPGPSEPSGSRDLNWHAPPRLEPRPADPAPSTPASEPTPAPAPEPAPLPAPPSHPGGHQAPKPGHPPTQRN